MGLLQRISRLVLNNKSNRLFCSGGKKGKPLTLLVNDCLYRTGNAEDLRKAVCDKMDRGMEFTVEECASITLSFAKCGSVDEANKLLKIARDKGLAPDESLLASDLRIRLNVIGYTARTVLYGPSFSEVCVLEVQFETHHMRGAAEEALELYRMGFNMNDHTYRLLLEVLSTHGNLQSVKSMTGIVQKMIEEGFYVDENTLEMLRFGLHFIGWAWSMKLGISQA